MPRKPRKNGNASKLIGSSNEQICIATGINDTNNVFLEIAGRGQLTNNSLKDILKDKIESECVISTDKRSNYKTILKLFNIWYNKNRLDITNKRGKKSGRKIK